MREQTRSMWTDWQLWAVIGRGYASPLLVLAALGWALWTCFTGGAISWASLALAGACALVLRDLFGERFETYRQRREIDRLREERSALLAQRAEQIIEEE